MRTCVFSGSSSKNLLNMLAEKWMSAAQLNAPELLQQISVELKTSSA
jgi:hypothetical protein